MRRFRRGGEGDVVFSEEEERSMLVGIMGVWRDFFSVG